MPIKRASRHLTPSLSAICTQVCREQWGTAFYEWCLNHYDAIIIGTGAGGGTLAYKLTPTGKRVLLLERGGYVPREKDNWNSTAVILQGKYQTKEVWRDRDGKELHPHTNYCVGGKTKFFGAALFQLRSEDFGEIRHHGRISPAGLYPTTSSNRITRPPSGSGRTAGIGAVPAPSRQP
jgi:hypothetical protein